jgi:hypothetical protein
VTILLVSYANIIAPYCLGLTTDFLHLRFIYVVLNTTKSDHIKIYVTRQSRNYQPFFGAYRISIVVTDYHFLGQLNPFHKFILYRRPVVILTSCLCYSLGLREHRDSIFDFSSGARLHVCIVLSRVGRDLATKHPECSARRLRYLSYQNCFRIQSAQGF